MQQAQISHEMCVTIGKAGLCHSCGHFCTLQWGTLSQVSGLLDSVTASYTSLPESALAPMQARMVFCLLRKSSYLLRPVESSPHIFCDHTSHSSSVHFGCSSSPPQPSQTSSLFCWLPLHESEYICTLLSILCLQFLLAPNSILKYLHI